MHSGNTDTYFNPPSRSEVSCDVSAALKMFFSLYVSEDHFLLFGIDKEGKRTNEWMRTASN